MPKLVICILKTQLQAEAMVSRLRAGGLATAGISVALLERSGILGLARDRDSQLDGGRTVPVQALGPAGGVLGMLTGIGKVMLPGAGAHILAGPLASAVAGTAHPGIADRGLADALACGGCPEARASQYAQRVSQGNILLAASEIASEGVDRVVLTLREGGAEDILVVEKPLPMKDETCADRAPAP